MARSLPHIKKTLRKTIECCLYIKHHANAVDYRAHSDRQDGWPERNQEMLGVTSSSKSDVTSRLALSRKDEIERQHDKYQYHIEQAYKHLDKAKYFSDLLEGLSHDEAQLIADSKKHDIKICTNCSRETLETTKNRCDACYKFYQRNGFDRSEQKKYSSIKAQS